jgi:hypothetical protein
MLFVLYIISGKPHFDAVYVKGNPATGILFMISGYARYNIR